MSSQSSFAVDPLVVEALKKVWTQQEELARQEKAVNVAERLAEKRFAWRWHVYEKSTNTPLKVFPTKDSMLPFLSRLRYQHGELDIKKKLFVVAAPDPR